MAEKQGIGYEFIYDMGSGLIIANVDIDSVKEQDVNARIMKNETQDQLTSNISKRGQLESLPLLALVNDKLEIVSGHHRIKSAREVGLKEIVAIVDVSGLNRSQIAAKQLAHNAISGFDDENTIKEICKLITDVDDMLESAVNKELFKEIEQTIEAMSMPDIKYDFKQIEFVFLKHQFDDLDYFLKKIPASDLVGVADIFQFEKFVNTLKKYQKYHDIKSVGTAIHLMIQSATNEMEGRGYDGNEDEWVNLAKLIGGGSIPKEEADIVEKAIKKAIDSGGIEKNEKWKLFVLLADNYVNG